MPIRCDNNGKDYDSNGKSDRTIENLLYFEMSSVSLVENGGIGVLKNGVNPTCMKP